VDQLIEALIVIGDQQIEIRRLRQALIEAQAHLQELEPERDEGSDG